MTSTENGKKGKGGLVKRKASIQQIDAPSVGKKRWTGKVGNSPPRRSKNTLSWEEEEKNTLKMARRGIRDGQMDRFLDSGGAEDIKRKGRKTWYLRITFQEKAETWGKNKITRQAHGEVQPGRECPERGGRGEKTLKKWGVWGRS